MWCYTPDIAILLDHTGDSEIIIDFHCLWSEYENCSTYQIQLNPTNIYPLGQIQSFAHDKVIGCSTSSYLKVI